MPQSSSAARFSDKQTAIAEILQGALALIAADGYAALSLRSLAERVGVSVRTVTHHLGDRAALVHTLISFAMERDLAAAHSWSYRAALLAVDDFGNRAMLADAAIDDLVVNRPGEAALFCELLHRRPNEPAAADAFERWLAARGDFWAAIGGGGIRGELLGLYCLDELPFSLSLSPIPTYCVMRRLGLTRLLAGGLARGPAAVGEEALFQALAEALAPSDSIVADGVATRTLTRRDEIAAHAAALILSHGVDHVTHRAVAAAAGAPSSTVVYQFGSREDLLIGGLESIIANFRVGLARVAETDLGAAVALYGDTIRATIAVALGANRFPKLSPHAADMRRRRGENVRREQIPIALPAGAVCDRLAAQLVAMCISGAHLAAPGKPLAFSTFEGVWRRFVVGAS